MPGWRCSGIGTHIVLSQGEVARVELVLHATLKLFRPLYITYMLNGA